ncbi:MAG: hypothetical protein OHK0012_28670 [Synechococcales cyanobacterium]
MFGQAGSLWAQEDASVDSLGDTEEPSTLVVEEIPAPPPAPVAAAGAPPVILEAKIDINNTILRNYRQLPGFYPNLARKLVEAAPYNSLEDLLKVPGLTAAQKDLIKQNFPNFIVGSYEPGNNTLENRINKGYYG